MARTDFPVCDAHLDAKAAWRCERCSRNLCEECGVGVPAGRGEITCCAACGGLVAEIRVPRALARPFPTEIRSAVLQALSPKALGLVAVVTCASQTLAWAGRDGWVVGNVLVVGWALLCLRLAAHGRPPFGRPTYAELGAALGGPLPRLAASAGVLALAAFWLVDGGQRAAPLLAASIVAALAIALLPPALIDAAVERPDHRWLLPWSLPAMERRIGSDIRPIRLAVVPFAAFALAQALLPPVDFRLDSDLAAHLTVAACFRFAWVLALAVLASLCGALVFTRAEELGHGDPAEYSVPAFPDARPRGSRAIRR